MRAPVLFLGAALLAFAVALCVGSVPLAPGQVAHAFGALVLGKPDPSLAGTLLGLRLARAFCAIAVGALLGVSGTLLQALLRNPLADPYVLGVSGGASCGAVAAIALGAGLVATGLCAGAGALAALAALFLLARRSLFAHVDVLDTTRENALLLTGVMIAALCSALLSIALAIAPDGTLRSMVYWLLGDLSGAMPLGGAAATLAASVLLAALAQRDAPALGVMMHGELQAYTQGVATGAVRRRLVAITALATGLAVATAGAVGFVGFIAPHLVRPWAGSDQRAMLPASALAGAALVLIADTLGRTIAAPMQLPLGAFTALVGAPVFLWRLQRS